MSYVLEQYWHISDNQKYAMNGTSVTMCDYCAIFGWCGNKLVYREECDYCATFGKIVYPLGKSETTVPLLVE